LQVEHENQAILLKISISYKQHRVFIADHNNYDQEAKEILLNFQYLIAVVHSVE